MEIKRIICSSVLGVYSVVVIAEAITEQKVIELDEGIVPFFAAATSGTLSSASSTFIAPF